MTGRLLPFDADPFQLRGDDGLQHKAARRFEAAIEVDGGQNRLQGVHQEGRLVAASALFLASPQVQVVPQLQFLRHPDQMLFADQMGSAAWRVRPRESWESV